MIRLLAFLLLLQASTSKSADPPKPGVVCTTSSVDATPRCVDLNPKPEATPKPTPKSPPVAPTVKPEPAPATNWKDYEWKPLPSFGPVAEPIVYKQVVTLESPGLEIVAHVKTGWDCHSMSEKLYQDDPYDKMVSITCVKADK